MAHIRSVLLLILVAFLFGCPGPKEPTRSGTDSYSGGDSVYGEDNNAVEDVGDAREIGEDRPLVFETDEIDKERLDTSTADNRASLNLDWAPIYFEFDKAILTEEAKSALRDYGRILLDNPNVKVLLEGHCDIRGTEEYNLALGERRAQQVKRYMLELGVNSSQIRTISYGELRPVDPAENERAWAMNRRVSFTF